MMRSIHRCCRFSGQKPVLRLPSFTHFPMHKSIFAYLESNDFHTPTYIQYGLFTKLFSASAGNQHHIVSSTGSGKTLAYLIPIVDQLKKEEEEEGIILTKSQRPRALVITSSKQLVLQVKNIGKDISHFAKLRCEGIGIGRSLNQQAQKVEEGVDILVSPYTRLKRMLDKRQVFLSCLKWIIVDEIDTMYQSQPSLIEQLHKTIIQPKLRGNVQLILSSTTNPESLKKYLSKKMPKVVQIVDKNAHLNLQNIKHEFLQCHELDKHEPLLSELKRERKTKTMIFCNTVKSLHELQYFLNSAGISVLTLHSQLSKASRLMNYENFRDLSEGVLLATDLGARGLHFPNLKKVINYDFPMATCDYLQRAGRTGRAGTKGTVVSLYFKKHLPIINELKNASFNIPLKIQQSAYGFKNRQETRSNKIPTQR